MAAVAYIVRPTPKQLGLSEEVERRLKIGEWQMFIVAMTVLIGGGYMLANPSTAHDAQVAAAGFIGAVVSYFFGARLTSASAAATLAAQQNGTPKPGA